ncbi:DUF1648 domain-containing protein [Pseudogracilibacillus sp. SO30301A]|uniref:DUF1648 domain-containing protein n=1 Tax=Pseudogracilibacillus sp. SO30301A TaxID=3098291 RepID=UPI00300DE586
MLNNHPKVPFSVNKWVYVLNSISIICIVGSIIYIVFAYQHLSDTIPIHFNTQGDADNWGSKNTVFIMPGITIILFVGIYFLSKFPHFYNYTVEVTEENAPRIYTEANLFMTIINLEIVLIFTLASVDITGDFLGVWFVGVVFGVPLVTLVVFALRLAQLK